MDADAVAAADEEREGKDSLGTCVHDIHIIW